MDAPCGKTSHPVAPDPGFVFRVVSEEDIVRLRWERNHWNESVFPATAEKTGPFYTVLQLAIVLKAKKIFHYLMCQKDIDVCAMSSDNRTSLIIAVQNKVSGNDVERILERGGSKQLDYRDPSGKTALDYCAPGSAVFTLLETHKLILSRKQQLEPSVFENGEKLSDGDAASACHSTCDTAAPGKDTAEPKSKDASPTRNQVNGTTSSSSGDAAEPKKADESPASNQRISAAATSSGNTAEPKKADAPPTQTQGDNATSTSSGNTAEPKKADVSSTVNQAKHDIADEDTAKRTEGDQQPGSEFAFWNPGVGKGELSLRGAVSVLQSMYEIVCEGEEVVQPRKSIESPTKNRDEKNMSKEPISMCVAAAFLAAGEVGPKESSWQPRTEEKQSVTLQRMLTASKDQFEWGPVETEGKLERKLAAYVEEWSSNDPENPDTAELWLKYLRRKMAENKGQKVVRRWNAIFEAAAN